MGLRAISVAALAVAGLLLPLAAQDLTLSTDEQWSAYVLYDAFFHYIQSRERLADEGEAKGPAYLRGISRARIARDLGLSEPEHAAFRAFLDEMEATRNDLYRQRSKIIEDFNARHPGFEALPLAERERLVAPERPQVAAVERQLVENILDHIQKIRVMLGPERFKTFDAYVHTTAEPFLGRPRPDPRLPIQAK